MLKKIDWYIFRKFIGTYLFIIFLIIIITVVIDLNEQLDKFLTQEVPVKSIIVDYYMNMLPYYANLFSPLLIFIAVILFTSNLAEHSEIIAMLAGGMSLNRIIRPYFIAAFMIMAFNLFLSTMVIPKANITRLQFYNTFIKNQKMLSSQNIQLQVDTGVIAYFNRFEKSSNTGYQFSLEKFEEKHLVSRLTARTIVWDSLHQWTINDYLIRKFDGARETIVKGARMDTIIPIEPADFLIMKDDQEQMTSPALYKYIRKQKERGLGNIQNFEIEYHRRFSTAFSTFILTLIGLSVSARKVKGGMGLNIGIGLALSFAYILFITVSSSFAVSGLTSAVVAVWIPNFVYLLIAGYLYKKAPN